MKIVCFGDSVTRGITYMKGRLRIVKDNYPALLHEFFGSKAEVVNKGVFNDNSDLLCMRLEKDVIEQVPDYVLIEIGGNDCDFRWDEVADAKDNPHTPIVPLDRYISNLQHLVKRIREAGATPILMNLIPLDPVRYYTRRYEQHGSNIAHWIATCGGIEHWHGMYNRALVQLAKEWDMLMLDVRTAFKEAGDLRELLSDDGIHPTRKGYRALADAIVAGLPRIAGIPV
ncbi:GDSL-type esterase/lipase family protein [Alicyclobacillus sp. SO9]|uniref:SGNH/GDSL hydrolase family protein n=1 Tax=Alicyclobacillus sp. SO9 TaxID=2665646 RepID=UPI0018E6E3D7|nr:GDSL-type esterase/lipase family protein [Alicyclobacillus sp. SO9]QQE78981.1 SGNH/GDSL hydrolase family protein [Alicyclobacillus sp. SO9]